MATAYSQASGSQPYVYLTFTGTSGATTMTYSWRFVYHASYAISTSSTKYVRARITDATGTHTLWEQSDYSINGKTGDNVIKTGTYTVNRTHSQQQVTGDVRIEFGSVVYSGTTLGTRTGSEYVNVSALASYSVTYNANGGTGAPSAQTKWQGESLKLSSSIPTRANYNFTGWNTAADGSGTGYTAGQTYTGNAALALYAQWELALVAPQITEMRLYHSDSAGEPKDDGTYLTMIATVTSGANASGWVGTTCTLYADEGTGVPTTQRGSAETVTGADQTLTAKFTQAGGFDFDKLYTAMLVASCTVDGTTATASAQASAAARFYTLDFAQYGNGVGIGTRAPEYPDEGLVIAMDTYLAGYARPLTDYPVHRGTDTVSSVTWEYTIWASGRVDCYGETSSVTASSWTQWGSTIIRYAQVGGDAYPTGLFQSAPWANADWFCTASDAWVSKTDGDSRFAPQLYIYRPVATGSATGYIRYEAHGTVNPNFSF